MDMLAVFRAFKGRDKGGKGTGKHQRKLKQPKQQQNEIEADYFRTYCAVSKPTVGNHYHWSFVIWHGAWEQFEVARTSEDGPWEANIRMEEPRNTTGCFHVTALADLPVYYLEDQYRIIQAVEIKQNATWNSQDYVLAIWEGIYNHGMIDEALYEEGRGYLMCFYGEVPPEAEAAGEGS